MLAAAPPVALAPAPHETTPIPSDSASPAKESRAGCHTFVTLACAAAAMACLLCLMPLPGLDQMWFLLMAQRWLHGAHLYGPQLFDSNPPLIIWLSALPITLARWSHLSAAAIGKTLVLALAACSWIACLHLARRLGRGLSRTAVWALAFAYIAVFACMPARDFGQREHLLALLCLPYLLAAALAMEGRPVPRRSAVLIGIAAGIGFSLKPHQLLVPIAVEAAVLWCRLTSDRIAPRMRKRAFRLEPLLLGAACLAYFAAIRELTPLYLTRAIPILRSTYWAIGGLGPRQLFHQAIQLHILAVVAVALALLVARYTPHNDPIRTITAVLLVAGFAAAAAYYIQGTGWYYQQLPALSFFALAAWIDLLALADMWELRAPRWAPSAALCLAVLAVSLTAGFSGHTPTRASVFASAQPSPAPAGSEAALFDTLPPGTPVAVLTTEVGLSIPPVYTHHLFWAQRMDNLWMLPAILRNEAPSATGPKVRMRRIPPARLAALDRIQHAWMVEDLTRWHPQLILIQRCQDPQVHCQALDGRHDNLLAWFARDPAFRAVFARYRYLRSAGSFDAYVPN